MSYVSDWFSANLLSLNLKKTNYAMFGNKKNSLIFLSPYIERKYHAFFKLNS